MPSHPHMYKQEKSKKASVHTTWTCPEAVGSAKYLGITISDNLTWKTYMDKTAAKASSTLGFLRRNLKLHQGNQREDLQQICPPYSSVCSICMGPLPQHRHQQTRTSPAKRSRLYPEKLLGQTARLCH